MRVRAALAAALISGVGAAGAEVPSDLCGDLRASFKKVTGAVETVGKGAGQAMGGAAKVVEKGAKRTFRSPHNQMFLQQAVTTPPTLTTETPFGDARGSDEKGSGVDYGDTDTPPENPLLELVTGVLRFLMFAGGAVDMSNLTREEHRYQAAQWVLLTIGVTPEPDSDAGKAAARAAATPGAKPVPLSIPPQRP